MKSGAKLWDQGVAWVLGVLKRKDQEEEPLLGLRVLSMLPLPLTPLQLCLFTLKCPLSGQCLLPPCSSRAKPSSGPGHGGQSQERTEEPTRRIGCQGFRTLHDSSGVWGWPQDPLVNINPESLLFGSQWGEEGVSWGLLGPICVWGCVCKCICVWALVCMWSSEHNLR